MEPLREYLLDKQTELNKTAYGCIMDINKNIYKNGKKLGYSWVQNCRYMCELQVTFFKIICINISFNFKASIYKQALIKNNSIC